MIFENYINIEVNSFFRANTIGQKIKENVFSDQIDIIEQELFLINPNYVGKYNEGGFAKGSAEGSVIKMKPMRMRSGGAAKRGYGKARR